MAYKVNQHQINQLINIVSKTYKTYANQKVGDKIVLDELKNFSSIKLFSKNTVMPFKKVLFPDGQVLNKCHSEPSEESRDPSSQTPQDDRVAIIGLNICDVHALHIFLKQFKNSSLVPSRENLFIIATSCMPDSDCFCEIFGANKIDGYDLYIQKEKDNKFSVFAGTDKAMKYLLQLNLKETKNPPKIKPIRHDHDEIDNDLNKIIDNKKAYLDFWQKIANNCFGCSACTAVCPLCFCFKQVVKNDNEGGCSNCLKYDSCFSKSFSEIHGRYDFRPQNIDRLYNWYHHKFVRGPRELNRELCVGCGRCIKACPANLNIKNILSALDEKVERGLENS